MSTIPTTFSSLQSAYDTWSFGLVTTSAGTLAWDLRCVQVVYCLQFVIFAVFPFYSHASFLYLSLGTCSPALQGAVGEASWAAEESGRVAAGGDQPLGVVFLWACGLPHTLHHSSTDLCLTQTTLIAFAKAESYLGGYKRIVPKTAPLVIQHIPTLP